MFKSRYYVEYHLHNAFLSLPTDHPKPNSTFSAFYNVKNAPSKNVVLVNNSVIHFLIWKNILFMFSMAATKFPNCTVLR